MTDHPDGHPSCGVPASPTVRWWLWAALGVSIACAAQWSFKARFGADALALATGGHLDRAALASIPRAVRHLIGDWMWLTADEYMHFGGSRRMGETFIAGTYAGNTEILPLLELAIRFNPSFIDAYVILAENQALHLDRFREGIRTLQTGLTENRDSPRRHELTGSIGFIYAFVDRYQVKLRRNPEVAARYLARAADEYERAGRPPIERPPLDPQSYHVVRSRMLVELGRPQESLAAWRASGLDLAASPDLLARYLRLVEAGAPLPERVEDLADVPLAGPLTAAPAAASGASPGSVGAPSFRPPGAACPAGCTHEHRAPPPQGGGGRSGSGHGHDDGSAAEPAARDGHGHPASALASAAASVGIGADPAVGEGMALPAGQVPVLLASLADPVLRRLLRQFVLLTVVLLVIWWRPR